MLTERSAAVGRTLGDFDFDGLVEVTGVRRRGERSEVPERDFRFEEGDVVVLLGRPGNLALAERRLMRG
jgi:CPA2 family monovalent cation:H+ antiporter-2